MKTTLVRTMKSLDEPAGDWQEIEVVENMTPELHASFYNKPLYDYKGNLSSDHGFSDSLSQPWYYK